MNQPNALAVGWGIVRSLITTTAPAPGGALNVDHSGFAPVLKALSQGGLPEAVRRIDQLDSYVGQMQDVDPNGLTNDGALAFWLNLFNAIALQVAVRAWSVGEDSVLRVPGAFRHSAVTVGGEALSLNDIEHGKLRRFRDPRIHGALVCGALSCPTLRATPYSGDEINDQLDDQMKHFFANGGALADGSDGVRLSRVVLWYGSDFARPHRMPTFIPASRKATLRAVAEWLPEEFRQARSVSFQDYDWALGCEIG